AAAPDSGAPAAAAAAPGGCGCEDHDGGLCGHSGGFQGHRGHRARREQLRAVQLPRCHGAGRGGVGSPGGRAQLGACVRRPKT
ncbi:unnamed protein product, partial [Effrenium voratum]